MKVHGYQSGKSIGGIPVVFKLNYMSTLRIKESTKTFQLAILLVGIFLLGLFCMERLISFEFESSRLTLNSLILSENTDK